MNQQEPVQRLEQYQYLVSIYKHDFPLSLYGIFHVVVFSKCNEQHAVPCIR